MDIDKTRGQIMSYINTKYKPVSCLSLRDSSHHSQDTEQCPIRQQDPTQIRTHNCQLRPYSDKKNSNAHFPRIHTKSIWKCIYVFLWGELRSGDARDGGSLGALSWLSWHVIEIVTSQAYRHQTDERGTRVDDWKMTESLLETVNTLHRSSVTIVSPRRRRIF